MTKNLSSDTFLQDLRRFQELKEERESILKVIKILTRNKDQFEGLTFDQLHLKLVSKANDMAGESMQLMKELNNQTIQTLQENL